jgi:AcrR family transcriptional regulator
MPTASAARAPRRDALANRRAILDAAAVVFRRDPESSIDAVAAEARLSRRAVYGHFGSREELLAELLVRGGARIAAALAAVHDDDPRVHLALIGASLWSEVSSVTVLAQLAVHGPLEQAVASALEPVRRSLRDATSRGAALGVFRPDLPTESLARLIEDAAISVLDEAVRSHLDDDRARRLVITTGLGVAGLSWRDADTLLADHPRLTAPAAPPHPAHPAPTHPAHPDTAAEPAARARIHPSRRKGTPA